MTQERIITALYQRDIIKIVGQEYYIVETIDDIQRATEYLLRVYGSTTTLDVKQYLRASGFFSEQQTVSETLAALAAIGTLEFTTEGNHRRYTAVAADTSEVTADAEDAAIDTVTATTTTLRPTFTPDGVTNVAALDTEYIKQLAGLPLVNAADVIEAECLSFAFANKVYQAATDGSYWHNGSCIGLDVAD